MQTKVNQNPGVFVFFQYIYSCYAESLNINVKVILPVQLCLQMLQTLK